MNTFLIMKCPSCGKEFDLRANIDVKPKTNADRIRAMSDEELMTWIMEMQACPYERYQDCQHPNYDCETCIKDWLKQEADE